MLVVLVVLADPCRPPGFSTTLLYGLSVQRRVGFKDLVVSKSKAVPSITTVHSTLPIADGEWGGECGGGGMGGAGQGYVQTLQHST